MRAQVVHNDLAPTNVLVDDTLASPASPTSGT